MINTARRPAHDSSARAADSPESHPSGIEPRAAVNAECKWLSRVVVFASQLSARYQATGTLAEAAKPASSVLLPEPAGATTNPTRCCQIRARRASTRSRARDCTWGIRTFADTTAVDASLTLASPHPTRAALRVLRQRDACAYPFNVLPATFAPRSVLRHTTRTFAFVNMVVANSPVDARLFAMAKRAAPRVRRVGTPCRIRTCDLVLRRHPLWSTELRGRGTADYKDGPDAARNGLLARRLRQCSRGEPAPPLEHNDRGQDEGAAKILDGIGPFPEDENRQQHAARRLEGAEDGRSGCAEQSEAQDECQDGNGRADHRKASEERRSRGRPIYRQLASCGRESTPHDRGSGCDGGGRRNRRDPGKQPASKQDVAGVDGRRRQSQDDADRRGNRQLRLHHEHRADERQDDGDDLCPAERLVEKQG